MNPSILLAIHNVGYILGSLLVLFLAGLVYVKDHKPLVNKLMILGFIGIVFFSVSHVIGVNVADSELSRKILMFDTAPLLFTAFFAHAIIAFIGKAREQRFVIGLIYTIQVGLFITFITFPHLFLLTSIPKLYFINYYQAGPLYFLMVIMNALIPFYFLSQMVRVYRTADPIMKNRLWYLFVGFLLAYSFGYAAVPLVLGIPTDPVWSIFFLPIFTGTLTYTILKYELMDITIIAKRAFIYGVIVVVVGLLITLLNILNNFVIEQIPDFPVWLFPFFSSIVAVSLGFLIWRKLREGDILKDKFITGIMHEFRTPLTEINWATESLMRSNTAPDQKDTSENLEQIKKSSRRLVELVDTLLGVK